MSAPSRRRPYRRRSRGTRMAAASFASHSGHRPPLRRGCAVIGADGLPVGIVSALRPDDREPTHLLVFVAERRQLIPREYRVPLSAVVRVDDRAVHVDFTRGALRQPGAGDADPDFARDQ